MAAKQPVKLIPRNIAARRRGAPAGDGVRATIGNPDSTRLESGVGNCFPGLECDLRNLERRFFPFLEVDILDNEIRVVSVDLEAMKELPVSERPSAPQLAIYRAIQSDLTQGRTCIVEELSANFGLLGQQSLRIADLSPPSTGDVRRPTDAWTAIRMIVEDTDIQITVRTRGTSSRNVLTGKRVSYLTEQGSLAPFFEPGELTQSLCSPWTHDFRDCGCYYWASNHPDISLAPLPSGPANEPGWNSPVAWERAERELSQPPGPRSLATNRSSTGIELRHYEINHRWQELNFVVEGREVLGPYAPQRVVAPPFATREELIVNLHYAASVELAVMQEYLTAAYSMRLTGLPADIQDDVLAAHAEIMRIAIGEMRHLRAVNDVLQGFAPVVPYRPALRAASRLPTDKPGGTRPVKARPANPEAIADFIAIEAPSISVDGLYARILVTLERDGKDDQRQTVRSIMADGEDHWETFRFVQEWLGRHTPEQYLRKVNAVLPPATNPANVIFQERYRALLDLLYRGYAAGLPAGAADINAARAQMPLANGIHGAAEAVSDAGYLVVFDPIKNDPRFTPLDPP